MDRNKILIVDDEIDLLEMYSELIKDEGFDVRTCKSGEEALLVIKEEVYGLIISDQNMFKVSGLDLLSYVNLNLPETPFFLVTGDRITGVEFENSKGRVVEKPVDIFSLIDLIKEAV